MDDFARKFEQRAAAPMFYITVLFMLLTGGAIHLWQHEALTLVAGVCLWAILLLYPLFIAEQFIHCRWGGRSAKVCLMFCLLPPLRLLRRDLETGHKVWLPGAGWTEVDDELVRRTDRAFTMPMIGVAFLVIPLLAVEYFWQQRIENSLALALSVHIVTALIWFAFALEFLVMISIVKKRWLYARQHWVDIVIIFIPLVAFLRAARLGRLLRLQQAMRTARVWRMRSVAMRAFRGFLLLDAVDRLLRGDEAKRLERMREQLAEKQEELQAIHDEIARLEKVVAERQAAVSEMANDALQEPTPGDDAETDCPTSAETDRSRQLQQSPTDA